MKNINEIFSNHRLHMGRMISSSKSRYREEHTGNNILFNANIVTSSGKIWWGDLDITSSKNELLNCSTELDETLYILQEMDARFENENESTEYLISQAIFIVDSHGISLGEKGKQFNINLK